MFFYPFSVWNSAGTDSLTDRLSKRNIYYTVYTVRLYNFAAALLILEKNRFKC